MMHVEQKRKFLSACALVFFAVFFVIAPSVRGATEMAEPGDFVLRAIRINPDQFDLRPSAYFIPTYDWRLVIDVTESTAIIADTYFYMSQGKMMIQTDRTTRLRLPGFPPLVLKPGQEFDYGISGEMSGKNMGTDGGLHSFFSFSDLSAIDVRSTDGIRSRDISGQWCFLNAQNPREARAFRFRRKPDGEGMPGYSPPGLEINWVAEMGESFGLDMTLVRFVYERTARREEVVMPVPVKPGPRTEAPDFVPSNCLPNRSEGHCLPRNAKTDRSAWMAAHARHRGCPCLREPRRDAAEGDRECCRIAHQTKWNGDCR